MFIIKIPPVSGALFDLRKRDFSYTFRLKDDCFYCNEYELQFAELDILKIHCLKMPIRARAPRLVPRCINTTTA